MIESYPLGRRVAASAHVQPLFRRLAAHFDVPKRPAILARQAASIGYWWLRARITGIGRSVAIHFRGDAESSLPQTLENLNAIAEVAVRRYRPGVIAGRPVLFVAARRPFRDGLYPLADFDGKFGWEGLTTDGLDIHEIPGDHNTMILDEPSLAVLARRLADCLSEAQRERAANERRLDPPA
jgi:hypothetical protein